MKEREALKARVDKLSEYLCLEHDCSACPGCVDDLRRAQARVAELEEKLMKALEGSHG
jgi:hypothetical protein